MILSFHPCFTADRQVILGPRSINSGDLSLIHEARVILLPQHCSSDLYHACKGSSASLFPNYDARFNYPGKVGQSLLFKKTISPHPETIAWRSVKDFKISCQEYYPHSMPFLIKANESHEAEGIYLIEDGDGLESSLENMDHLASSGSPGFISQELIHSGGNVLRSVIIGKKIITYWKRPEKTGQIITSISKGAKIDKKWRTDLQDKGRRHVQKFSDATKINLAAIDSVFPIDHDNPQPLFLEINYYFGRRGLGGSAKYYKMLYGAIQEWLIDIGSDPKSVELV